MSNSYTPPDRSTYDPGWNDPPPMPSAAGQVPVAGKPRLNLNKRVAFPMQSSVASSGSVKTTAEGLPLPFSTAKYQPPPMNASPLPTANVPTTFTPPPPPATAIFNPNSTTTTETVELDEAFDSLNAKQFSQNIFSRLVDAMSASNDKVNEIRKRLEIIDQMWTENKLNESAQKTLYQLAQALENNDATTAMEKHRVLSTQHINVSSQWAIALRQIILSISSEADDSHAPAVLPETEVTSVQFMDVSSKPVVMDNVPLPPLTNPLPVSHNQPIVDNISNPNDSAPQTNTTTTSRFGRFGRILHL